LGFWGRSRTSPHPRASSHTAGRRAGQKSRSENPAGAAHNAHPPVCPAACRGSVMKSRERCNKLHNRRGNPSPTTTAPPAGSEPGEFYFRPAISALSCAAWSAVSTFSATASTVPSVSNTKAARAGPKYFCHTSTSPPRHPPLGQRGRPDRWPACR